MISPNDTFAVDLGEYGSPGTSLEVRAGSAAYWIDYERTLAALKMSEIGYIGRVCALVGSAICRVLADGTDGPPSVESVLSPRGIVQLAHVLPVLATIGPTDKKKLESQSQSNGDFAEPVEVGGQTSTTS